jgi:DNA ligase (NAD+)
MTDIAQKIELLREELRKHNYSYYVLDNPTISDYEFDVKLKLLQELCHFSNTTGWGRNNKKF